MQGKLTTGKTCKLKTCGKKFDQKQFGQVVCNFECSIDYAKQLREEKEEKEDKEWKVEKKEMIERSMTLSDYMKRLQAPINKIVRLIDKDHGCMMCGNLIKKDFGCHFHAVGSNPAIRFHLFNIWSGCFSCNGMKGGNIPGYEQEILKHFGFNKLDTIKSTIVRENPYLGLNKQEVKELIPIASKIVRDLEKLDLEYSNAQRWKLREKFNKILGIYK